MRISLVVILGLIYCTGTAQQLNTPYRTAVEDNLQLHYLVFTDEFNCKVIFPLQNHADAMLGLNRGGFNVQYKTTKGTLTFILEEANTVDLIVDRLQNARFILTSDNYLFDSASGFTYLDENLTTDKYTIYSFEGKIYKQKAAKVDGYGLIRKSYKMKGRLKRKLKAVDEEKHTVSIIKGKEAFEKYGLIGMNGVFEIKEK